MILIFLVVEPDPLKRAEIADRIQQDDPYSFRFSKLQRMLAPSLRVCQSILAYGWSYAESSESRN